MNSAYHFNGTQKIQFNGAGKLTEIGNQSPVFTMSVWFKTESNSDQVLLGGFGWGYLLYVLGNGNVQLSTVQGVTGIWTNSTSISILNDGCWHLAVVSKSANTVKVYVDGNLEVNSNVINNSFSPYGTSKSFFGANGQDNNLFFTGSIDDVCLWNRELSSLEVANLYDVGIQTVTGNFFDDEIVSCDSEVMLNVAVTSPLAIYVWNNDTIVNSEFIISNSGVYFLEVFNSNCRLVDTVNVLFNQPSHDSVFANIQFGDSIIFAGTTLKNSGVYTYQGLNVYGCDSTVTLTLSVEPLLTCNINAPTTTLCEGESATLSVNTTGGPGASTQLPANLQQGLVAYYPFNGNANDESGNGNNGTVNGATLASDRFGNVGSAYSFDGVSDLS